MALAKMLPVIASDSRQNGSFFSPVPRRRMSQCLHLTRSGEYAITALARLALASEGAAARPVPIRELAEDRRIPKCFLTKILTQCAKRGIVTCKKGPAGGVSLARPSGQISLLEVVEACEGDYSRESCVFFPQRRCPGPVCEVYCPLRQEEEKVRDSLRAVSLADMAQALRTHPDSQDVRNLQGRQRWKTR
jgi:Rrf2 family protein